MTENTRKMNLAEYSRYRGVTTKTVKRHIVSGVLPVQKDGDNYIIDVQKCDMIWIRDIDPNAQLPEKSRIENQIGPAPTTEKKADASKSYADYRKEKEKWASKKARLEYEFKAGVLVEASKVKTIAFETGKITRENLMALPDRLAHEFAAELDPKNISIRLEEELTKALDEIARVPDKLKKLTEDILKNKRKNESKE